MRRSVPIFGSDTLLTGRLHGAIKGAEHGCLTHPPPPPDVAGELVTDLVPGRGDGGGVGLDEDGPECAATCAADTSTPPSPSLTTGSPTGPGRGSRGGRRPTLEPERYKQRNVVERAISKLKQHRAFATRTDKRECMFHGTVDVATIRIWLRDLTK